MEHADWGTIYPYLVWTLVAIIGLGIALASAGKKLHIRRLPAIDAIEEAVGRATEMGRPMMFVPGLAGVDVPTFKPSLSLVMSLGSLLATEAGS